MGDFVELGFEGVNHLVDKHWEKGWDYATGQQRSSPPASVRPAQDRSPSPNNRRNRPGGGSSTRRSRRFVNDLPPPEQPADNDNDNGRVTNVTYRRSATAQPQPPPPPPPPPPPRSDSLERQSQTSERVIRAYEGERDDPRRKPESVLSRRDLNRALPTATTNTDPNDNTSQASRRRRRRSSKTSNNNNCNSRTMSNANGYAPYENVGAGWRSRSQQPPGRGYYDDNNDDGYGSDYDDRTGRRYSNRGRGYDDDDDDRRYDREFVETERYRGPARNFPRQDSYTTTRAYDDGRGSSGGAYAATNPAGAMTQYRRSANDVSGYNNNRSRSRGRRDRDRSNSRSPSGSRSGGDRDRGFRGKIDEHFDTSLQGLGVGLAGAVVGGLAGRQLGGKGPHRNRDILIGAVVGGLASNAAEHKWRDWKEEKKERLERDEERWENRWDGRSRSAVR